MRFDRFVNLLSFEKDVAVTVARKKRRWNFAGEWIENYGALVSSRDMDKLHFILPDDYLRAVFRRLKQKFYLAKDGWLRSRRHSPAEKELSAIEAFERFGGDAMEETVEYGSFPVRGRRVKFSTVDNWEYFRDYKVPGLKWRKRWFGGGYITRVNGRRWHIRVNNFPDEPAYTLIVYGREILHFNEWPAEWTK
jgi:hypothetical protein